MIECTHNNPALFLQSVSDWLARRDVRELRYSDDHRECAIVISADDLKRGQVTLRIAGMEECWLPIPQLEATMAAWLAGANLPSSPVAALGAQEPFSQEAPPGKSPPLAQGSFDFNL